MQQVDVAQQAEEMLTKKKAEQEDAEQNVAMLAQTLQTREEESQAVVKAANEAQAAYEQIKERYEAVIHAKQVYEEAKGQVTEAEKACERAVKYADDFRKQLEEAMNTEAVYQEKLDDLLACDWENGGELSVEDQENKTINDLIQNYLQAKAASVLAAESVTVAQRNCQEQEQLVKQAKQKYIQAVADEALARMRMTQR